MMRYFATPYTIHFDDTMAYGSHHFLTSFKFQCSAREALLFGQQVYDVEGVRESLQQVHLLTVDAYTRNLHPARLGERIAILLTIEEWGRGSVRFCYRVINEHQQPICAGFQTIVCADPVTQLPKSMPHALEQALETLREVEERSTDQSFRQRVLSGGSQVSELFGPGEYQAAGKFLAVRYPTPHIVSSDLPAVATVPQQLSNSAAVSPVAPLSAVQTSIVQTPITPAALVTNSMASQSAEHAQPPAEAWVFAGQGAVDATLLSQRLAAYQQHDRLAYQDLKESLEPVADRWGPTVWQLLANSPADIAAALQATPALSQLAIHLQNVLGARIRQSAGYQPAYLLGHSFGEIAALQIAGCFDLKTGLEIVQRRVEALELHAPAAGGLMVASCSRSIVEAERHIHGYDQVVVAGRNHDQQTLLSGPISQLLGLKDRLQTLGIGASQVPSSTSFHHPQLRRAAEHWLNDLRGLVLRPPTLPVYSAIGRQLIGTGDDVGGILAGQFVRPFDLQGAVAELTARGATTFVDCGSSGSLARLLTKAGAAHVTRCTDAVPVPASIPAAASVPTSANYTASTPAASTDSQPSKAPVIAITGQGCLLPGGASTPAKLYSAIVEHRLGIVDMRDHDPHWSMEFYAEKLTADRSNSHLAGRVQDEDFQPPAGVEPAVFQSLSRTQQLLCIALAPCLTGLQGAKRIGCFMGATADGFEDLDNVAAIRYAGIDPDDQVVDACLRTARSAAHTPHLAVQQVFDLLLPTGVEVTLIDAACASSLYAVALGMRALESFQVDAVIAGGVFCPGPGNSCLFSQFRGTTSSGCRPFDADADGVVFSEGSALLTLRRLADAERLGLHVDATVIGAGLSSDGKSSSANVPQTRGQIISLQRCYSDYAIDPASIVAIEGHGTSTPVGDSTELETLRQFFVDHTSTPIPVHSLKGLLGHAGWAAGTASIIAACEFMRHRVFPEQANHRAPSAALLKAAGTLRVLTAPTELPAPRTRLAIDGFGFGGANAHVVLEAYQPHVNQSALPEETRPGLSSHTEDEPVIVVCERIATDTDGRFSREQTKLPAHCVVLPQLADDMDISQILTCLLTEQILARLPQCDAEFRKCTSLVLAMNGKTERGVEAILRIMTQRFQRLLSGNTKLLSQLEAAHQTSRPSGAYTLQCMMPNVAAGRAALLSNLNGPNFVVDGGQASLRAALNAASLVLCSGAADQPKLTIVAAMEASSLGLPQGAKSEGTPEFAVALAITTRRCAQQFKLPIMASVESALRVADISPHSEQTLSPYRQIQRLLSALGMPADESASSAPQTSSAIVAASPQLPLPATAPTSAPTSTTLNNSSGAEADACGLYLPVWIEKDCSQLPSDQTAPPLAPLLCIVPAHCPKLSEIQHVLRQASSAHLLVVVSYEGLEQFQAQPQQEVLRVNLNHHASVAVALERIAQLAPAWTVAVDAVETWDRSTALKALALDNCLSEFLFLVAQSQVTRLSSGQFELWGLLLDGWRERDVWQGHDGWHGQVHPQSGPVAGLLKSISREFPASRTGTLCTAGVDFNSALHMLLQERCQREAELEIARDQHQRRWVRRLRKTTPIQSPHPVVQLDQNAVVLATGGAKGVTAVMLDALVRDYRCRAVVLGRSLLAAGPSQFERPEIEQQFYQHAWEKNPKQSAIELKQAFATARASWEAYHSIEQLNSLGGQVEYLPVDVTNSQQVAHAVDEVVSRYGKIDLILHGAGIQTSKRLEDRTLADFRQTFAVKVAGLYHLQKHCQQRLGHMIPAHLLTSAYSVFGNDGQHDYGAANEALDRLCDLNEVDTATPWTSLAWLAWDGIGMTRGSEYRALAKSRRLSAIKPELGQRLFRQVIAGETGGTIHVPMCDAEHLEYRVKTIPPGPVAHASQVRELNVDLTGISCLPYHRVRNTPTLPGAWILDLLVEGARQFVPNDTQASVVVHELSFDRFVRLTANQNPNLRVIAEWVDGAVHVWMLADVMHPAGDTLIKDVTCASAIVKFEPSNPVPTAHPLTDIGRAANRQAVHDPYCQARSSVSLSGMFDCLRDIEIGTTGRRAQFYTNQVQGTSRNIPALLLDAAWRVGAMYADSQLEKLFVPVKVGRLFLPLQSVGITRELTACRIVSSPPQVIDRTAHWKRTEVFDATGQLKIVVEDASAALLN